MWNTGRIHQKTIDKALTNLAHSYPEGKISPCILSSNFSLSMAGTPAFQTWRPLAAARSADPLRRVPQHAPLQCPHRKQQIKDNQGSNQKAGDKQAAFALTIKKLLGPSTWATTPATNKSRRQTLTPTLDFTALSWPIATAGHTPSKSNEYLRKTSSSCERRSHKKLKTIRGPTQYHPCPAARSNYTIPKSNIWS